MDITVFFYKDNKNQFRKIVADVVKQSKNIHWFTETLHNTPEKEYYDKIKNYIDYVDQNTYSDSLFFQTYNSLVVDTLRVIKKQNPTYFSLRVIVLEVRENNDKEMCVSMINSNGKYIKDFVAREVNEILGNYLDELL